MIQCKTRRSFEKARNGPQPRFPVKLWVCTGIEQVLPWCYPYDYRYAMSATTTLKLPERLKTRIARLAKQTQRTTHGFMVEALEREVAREERMRNFIREALAADTAIENGAAVYRAEDVHSWLERLARNRKAARPKPWRK